MPLFRDFLKDRMKEIASMLFALLTAWVQGLFSRLPLWADAVTAVLAGLFLLSLLAAIKQMLNEPKGEDAKLILGYLATIPGQDVGSGEWESWFCKMDGFLRGRGWKYKATALREVVIHADLPDRPLAAANFLHGLAREATAAWGKTPAGGMRGPISEAD